MSLASDLAEFDAPFQNQLSYAVRNVHQSVRDDARQEGRLHYWLCLQRFDASRAKLKTFVDRRIRGAVVDLIRREDSLTRGQRKAVQDGRELNYTRVEEGAIYLAADAPSPERLAMAKEAVALLALLPEKDRTLLTKIFLEGRTATNVARELGVAPSGVTHRKMVALRRIREAIGFKLTVKQ